MRVLQIVTLVSPDGAYGGPVTVALNQCHALQNLGHDAHVAGGHVGKATVAHRGSVQMHLFPVHVAVPAIGFAGLTSVALLRWLASSLSSWDVVHVHMARDLVTLPAARLAEARHRHVVIQPHGMIDPSERLLARPLDALLTRGALRGAEAVCHLTTLERDQLVRVAGERLNLVPLHNGVPVAHVPDGPVPSPNGQEVLYLARLQKRKRPLMFVQAALALAPQHPRTTFALAGPDEGEGRAVASLINSSGASSVRWEGAVPPERVMERLSRASVFVLPAVDEPYPMAVLEAMSLGIPVVITESCGLAEAVRGSGVGVVIGTGLDDLTRAVDTLLADEGLRASMGARARVLACERFSMEQVAQTLLRIYGQDGGSDLA